MSDVSPRPSELKTRIDDLSDAKRALLARRLAERAANRDGIPARADATCAPLSAAQEELWLLEQLAPGVTAYNLSSGWRIRGRFDERALQRALDLVVQRHESLRAVFSATGSGVEQRFTNARAVALSVASVDGSASDFEAQALRLLENWAAIPFDLSSDLLLRAGIVRVSDDDRYLTIITHHLATDGVSRGVLFEEIAAAYKAFAHENEPQLTDVRVPFGDYAEWERSAPTLTRLSSQIEFWRAALLHAPESLDLPLDHARSNAPSFVGGRATRTLSPPNLALLNDVAHKQHATPFMVLMSAFSTLLGKYSGNDDLVVGVPTAGRARTELSKAVGLYTNTVAVRARLSNNPTFAELVAQIRETTLASFENQEVPFARVVTALREAGRPAHAPVFRVMFAMQNHGAATLGFDGVTTEPVGVKIDSTKFDLTMLVSERAEGLRMTLEFRTDLYEQDSVDRMLAHFERLLIAALHDPTAAIASLPLMDDQEREQVVVEWNATDRAYPSVTLSLLLEEQRQRTPQGIAVGFEGETVTYAQLHERADKLASALAAVGVKPGVLVAVAAERSVELVVALLGVLKAGGAYVPLDPDYPADRLSYMLEDSAPQVLLTQRGVVSALPTFSGPTLLLDDDTAWPNGNTPAHIAGTDDAAYMIYTSGSTGRPKGALNAHSGIVNRLLWMQDQYQLTPNDVVLQKTPYSFDVSVWEFFWPLIVGARLAVARPGGHRDPQYLIETIAREGVTTMHFVPSMLRAFLASVAPIAPNSAKSLRQMMCSGEALSADLVAGVFANLPNVGLHNLYGPTECAVDVTHWTCTPQDASEGTNVPIGRPVANTQLYVLDAAGHPLPAGVPGELFLAGVQVGMGYHGRPELTAERFVADRFSRRADAKMYRTGDRARWRNDGSMEYLGRLDDQIKLRGFRIELGEIGAAMQRHEAIADAVAVLREERDGIVVGYAIPSEETAAPVRRLLQMENEVASSPLKTFDLPNGMSVLHRNRGETEFLYREIFEGDGYLRHGLTIGDNDVVFDVGANIGLFTVFAGTRARNARVFAFEPIPPIFATLAGNARVYDVPGRMFNCGLGSKPETVTFTYYPHNTVLSGRFASAEAERAVVERFLANDQEAQRTDAASMKELLDENLESENFPCVIRTLSDVVREEKLDRIDLLKIDVEKAEWDVLSGIDDATWPLIRQTVIEVHDENGRLQQVLDLLNSKGFTCVAEEEQMLAGTGLYAVYARRANAKPSLPATGHVLWSSKARLAESVTALISQQLPDYMVPADIVFLDAFPLTSSGKLNRRALPAPNLDDDITAEPPAGPVEEVVASVWRQALHVSFVSRTSNFFSLGGHSLTMTTLLAGITKLFRMQLPLRTAFESPTVAGMAAALIAREAKPGQVVKIATIISKLQAQQAAGATEQAERHA